MRRVVLSISSKPPIIFAENKFSCEIGEKITSPVRPIVSYGEKTMHFVIDDI